MKALGAFADCVPTFDQAIAMKDAPELRTYRAVCKLGAKDTAGAKDDLTAAIAAQYAPAHFYLARILGDGGDWKGAVTEYETFLKLEPNVPASKVAREKLKLAKEHLRSEDTRRSSRLSSILTPDAVFWRKLARFGAARGPSGGSATVPRFRVGGGARRALGASRGPRQPAPRPRQRGPVREAMDVAHTFSTYAGCLAEVLSSDSKNQRRPSRGPPRRAQRRRALAPGKGIVLVTAHTAGWEMLGPCSIASTSTAATS